MLGKCRDTVEWKFKKVGSGKGRRRKGGGDRWGVGRGEGGKDVTSPRSQCQRGRGRNLGATRQYGNSGSAFSSLKERLFRCLWGHPVPNPLAKWPCPPEHTFELELPCLPKASAGLA